MVRGRAGPWVGPLKGGFPLWLPFKIGHMIKRAAARPTAPNLHIIGVDFTGRRSLRLIHPGDRRSSRLCGDCSKAGGWNPKEMS